MSFPNSSIRSHGFFSLTPKQIQRPHCTCGFSRPQAPPGFLLRNCTQFLSEALGPSSTLGSFQEHLCLSLLTPLTLHTQCPRVPLSRAPHSSLPSLCSQPYFRTGPFPCEPQVMLIESHTEPCSCLPCQTPPYSRPPFPLCTALPKATHNCSYLSHPGSRLAHGVLGHCGAGQLGLQLPLRPG